MNEWAGHSLFYRMLFDFQIYGKVVLDDRYIERLLKVKVSDMCIFCMAVMPDGTIVADANNRATIFD